MLKKITENVEIHQTLPDTPNLTSEELKKEWDKGNKIIKEKFNELIDSLNDAEVLELKEKIVGTVLYEDDAGTTGDITLNDNKENYDEIEIQGYLKASDFKIGFTSGKMSTSLKRFSISMNRCVGENQVQLCQELITIEGTSCVRTYGNFITYIDLTLANYGQFKFYITKITGYKEV